MKFKPKQEIVIISYGLNYPGSIVRCIKEGDEEWIYDVEYVFEGSFYRREFYESQLKQNNIKDSKENQ